MTEYSAALCRLTSHPHFYFLSLPFPYNTPSGASHNSNTSSLFFAPFELSQLSASSYVSRAEEQQFWDVLAALLRLSITPSAAVTAGSHTLIQRQTLVCAVNYVLKTDRVTEVMEHTHLTSLFCELLRSTDQGMLLLALSALQKLLTRYEHKESVMEDFHLTLITSLAFHTNPKVKRGVAMVSGVSCVNNRVFCILSFIYLCCDAGFEFSADRSNRGVCRGGHSRRAGAGARPPLSGSG